MKDDWGYRGVFENERGFMTKWIFSEIFCGKRSETCLFYREIRGGCSPNP